MGRWEDGKMGILEKMPSLFLSLAISLRSTFAMSLYLLDLQELSCEACRSLLVGECMVVGKVFTKVSQVSHCLTVSCGIDGFI